MADTQDVIKYWCELYETTYRIPYLVNYKREGAMVKRLLKVYGRETVLEVVEFVIGNYIALWGNSNYPLPTIGMLSSWLFNQALPLLVKSKVNMVEPVTINEGKVYTKNVNEFWGE